MRSNASLIASLVVLAATPALAQQASDSDAFDRDLAAVFSSGGLTADQAAARAVATSPAAKRKAAERAQADAQVLAAKLSRVPRLTGAGRYTRLSDIEQPMLAPGFSLPVQLNAYSLSAEVAVPLSDHLLRITPGVAAAKAGVRAAELGRQLATRGAANQARVAYYEYVRSRLGLVVAQRQLTQVTRTLEQVSALVAAQRASRADQLRLEALRAQAELGVVAAENGVAIREAELRIAMGAGDEPIAIGEDVRTGAPTSPTEGRSDLRATAQQQRLELKAIDQGIEAVAQRRRVAQAGRLPRLDAFAQVNYDNPNQRIFPSDDEFHFTWAVGAQVSWALGDLLSTSAEVKGLRAEASALAADRQAILQGIELELRATQSAYTLAERAIATTAAGLAAAEESYRVRRALLEADRATVVEMVDAETELTRARVSAIDARIDLRIAAARLRHAAGLDE